MQYELIQKFYFEAAHTLERERETASSRRVHGHTYLAEIRIAGTPGASNGMVIDLAEVRSIIDEVRARLDHHYLNEVEGLGRPTLENLCAYLWRVCAGALPIAEVTVRREASGDGCTLRGLPL